MKRIEPYGISSYQEVKNASLYEPRINYIKGSLERILSMVELIGGGGAIKADGFRLKNLKDWLVRSACDPIEIYGYAGSRCNINCAFCYNRGNPPSLATGNLRRKPEEEYHEMMTRLRYMCPRAGLNLYPALGDTYEVLIHPRILDVLRPLRRLTDKAFRIATNGAALTRSMIGALSGLSPVYLYISVEAISESDETHTSSNGAMRIPASVLRELAEAGIPYAIVLVPWPVGRSVRSVLDSMSETVELAERCQAHLVEINLPGHTRHFCSHQLFNLEEVWSATVAHVRSLRENCQTPIVAMPAMYEENLYEEVKNLPSVIGLIRNSPAERAGIERGDLIKKINDINIVGRPQARDLLSTLRKNGTHKLRLTLNRAGEEVEKEIDTSLHSYPYSYDIDQHLGIITLGAGLRLSYIEDLKRLIERRSARRVLFLSSKLVKPVFRQLLAGSPLFADPGISVDIVVPANYFLGGNIFMGDLLTVHDFIRCIDDYLKSGKEKPDLVVIPSSPFNLSAWGRDLTGRCYLDIERAAGLPVALLPCDTIYD